MSHTIFVPLSAGHPPAATFAKLAGLQFHIAPTAWETDEEYLVWRDGSARGVAVQPQDEGTAIRIFTCASRVDVDLAIDAVVALANDAAGSGGFFKRMMSKTVLAVNEDDEEFKSIAEIQKRYNDAFRTQYVAWGPQEIANHVEPGASISLTGPWCYLTIEAATFAQLRATAANPDAFSQNVLNHMLAQQAAGRQLRQVLRHGDSSQLASVPLPQANGVVAAWLAEDAALIGPQMMWQTAARLPPAVLQANVEGVLQLVPDLQEWNAPLGRAIFAQAIERANSDPGVATSLANFALEAAQAGAFVPALAAFDVIVDMAPQNVGNVMVESQRNGQASGQRLAVNAQSSWACNATWAVQADNNKMPVDAQRARNYLAKCLPYAPSNPAIYLNATCIAVELGDINEALNYTSLAKRCGYQGMQAFVDEPMLAPLRNHPRFAQALAGG